MSAGVKPLKVADTYLTCPTDKFKFKTTKEFKQSHDIIAQTRAVRAINLGLGIRKPGYNIFVAGYQGTGKTSVIKTFLEKWSKNSETPKDWVYVYNYHTNENPNAIQLEPGQGHKFKKRMNTLIKKLKEDIPAALQSEDYENAVNAYISASNDRKSKLFSDLEKLGKQMDFQVKSTRMGIETIPIVDGRQLTEKEYSKLSDEGRETLEDKRSQIEPEVLDFARKVRAIETETKEYVEKLRDELGEHIVATHVDPIIETFKEYDEVVKHLKSVKEEIVEHLLDFVEDEDAPDQEMFMASPEERDPFRKYRVNVFIDNTKTNGAPVIIETNPTYYNLFGRIEKNVEHGMYLTDFTMIKPGSIHKADGGYLVLDAMDVFRTGSTWDTLKRVLKNRLGYIEDMGEQYSLLPTSGLRPEPIPLDVKVILIGSDDIYHILFDADEDFHKIFKIKADFDYKMDRNVRNTASYASFVATRTHIEKLTPFDRSGVAAVVEFGSRLVEDQRLLSTQFGELKDLTIEADYMAKQRKAKLTSREDVMKALDEKFYRVNLYEEHLLEMVKNEDILLTVKGTHIGQVNGLAVYDLGDYAFGKLGRITCTTSMSEGGILNIERASKLSGRIHDKGVLILSGFLKSLLAKKKSLGISAAICFEQSYGMIDGDSATIAELVAIISALSEIPVDQSFAMTGSLNQFGEVQPIGGVNEKIEGFFKTAQLLGMKNGCSVLIPHQNVPNLMLHRDVQDAVKAGTFKIYPIKTFDEAFELATGHKLGIKKSTDSFSPGSALDIIEKKLEKLREEPEEEDEKPKKKAKAKKKAAKKKATKKKATKKKATKKKAAKKKTAKKKKKTSKKR